MFKKIKLVNIVIALLLSCTMLPDELELTEEMMENNFEKPLITNTITDTLLEVGDSLRLSISADGDSLVYNWYADTTLLASGGDSSYLFENLALDMDSALIWCAVQNSGGTDTSDTSLLQVLLSPTITSDPKKTSVKFENDAIFKIEVNGSEPLSYQWYMFDTIAVGTNSSTYTFTATTLADSGKYFKCIVSNPVGVDTSKTAILSVVTNIALPNITTDPKHLNKTVGNSATFYIAAEGTDLSYQWLRNDSIITFQTAPTLIIDSVRLIDHGSKFRCIAKNSAGADTSAAATLQVSLSDEMPQIINEPDSITVTVGEEATFTIEANGTDLKYQWYKNNDSIPNENDDYFTLNFTTIEDSGSLYYCIVSNTVGSDTSRKALLSVIDTIAPPKITTDLKDETVLEGNPATFFVVATGENCIYNWRINGILIDSLKDSLITFSSPMSADSGTTVQCLVSNIKDTVESTVAILKVSKTAIAVSITEQPTAKTVAVDSNAIFSVLANGSDISYQWYKNGAIINDETSYQLNLLACQFDDSGSLYHCNISNSISDTATDTVQLHVLKVPTIESEPETQVKAKDSSVTFSVIAGGSGPFMYQWLENGNPIDGESSSSYSRNSLTMADNGKQFICIVSNAIGSITSVSALLTVAEAPIITDQSNSMSKTSGATAEFFITATGTGPLFYQWFVDGDSIIGADSTHYTIDSVKTTDNGKSYTCKVHNIVGSDISNPATITVAGYPTITIFPETLSVAFGSDTSFKVSLTGDNPLNIDWYKNGTLIDGFKDSVLSLDNVTMTDSGGEYYCIVTNQYDLKDTTEIGYLKVLTKPGLTLTNESVITVQPETPIYMGVTVAGSQPIDLQWYKDGFTLTNKTSANYSIASAKLSDNGSSYYCIATNEIGVKDTSDTIFVNVYEPVKITNGLPYPTIVSGGTFTFHVVYTGSGDINVQWYKNGVAVPAGGTDSVYTTPYLFSGDSGCTYFAIVSNEFSSDTSDTAIISIPTDGFPYKQISPIADVNVAPGYKDSLTPMFVCFAMNGNGYVDGVNWLRNTLESRTNPAGNGNNLTFDQTTPKGTFFVVGSYAAENFKAQSGYSVGALKDAWTNLYSSGHEIGNNSWSNPHGKDFTVAQWIDEIEKANSFLDTAIGVSPTDIKGFRAPWLEYSQNTVDALKQKGLKYDCSIEFGFNFWMPVDPDTGFGNSTTKPESYKKLFWPYTLNSAPVPGFSGTSVTADGIWEVMLYTKLKTDESGVITGHDFNMWSTYTKQETIDILKKNFDLRREGNRCPFMFNGNTEYYSQFLPDQLQYFPNSTWSERREAVEEFIDYVLSFPETRIVTINNVLDWMKNPSPLQ